MKRAYSLYKFWKPIIDFDDVQHIINYWISKSLEMESEESVDLRVMTNLI
jgi:hypothetical protein